MENSGAGDEQSRALQEALQDIKLKAHGDILSGRFRNADDYLSEATVTGQEYDELVTKTFTAGTGVTPEQRFGELGTGFPARVQAIDSRLHYSGPEAADFSFWNSLPKVAIDSVQLRYVQMPFHARDRFKQNPTSEGAVNDNQTSPGLVHRNIDLQTLSVKAAVTYQAAATQHIEPAVMLSTKSAMITLLRSNAYMLFHGNPDLNPHEYAGINYQLDNEKFTNGLYPNGATHKSLGLTHDVGGRSLAQGDFVDISNTMRHNFGISGYAITTPGVYSEFLKNDYFHQQRIMLPQTSGTLGVQANRIVGVNTDIALIQDIFIEDDNNAFSLNDAPRDATPGSDMGLPALADVTTTGLLVTVAATSTTATNQPDTDARGARNYAVQVCTNRYWSRLIPAVDAANPTQIFQVNAGTNSTQLTFTSGNLATLLSQGGDDTYLRIYATDPQLPTGRDVYAATTEVRASTVAAASANYDDNILFYYVASVKVKDMVDNSVTTWDDNYDRLPNCSTVYLSTPGAIEFLYLFPPSYLQLAVTNLTRPYAAFLTGTPYLPKPTKFGRIKNAWNGTANSRIVF